MASCSCTTGMMGTFGWCAPTTAGTRLTSHTTQHLRTSRAPPTTRTSLATTAGVDRALGKALVSTTTSRSRAMAPACNARPRHHDLGAPGEGGQTLAQVVAKVYAVVMVHSGNNNLAPEVYGSITVVFSSPFGYQPSYTLFKKTRDQAVKVPKNTAIPLQGMQVATQVGSRFQVYANLWDASKLGPPDHQIVEGSVSFVPKEIGADSDDIRAFDGGQVRMDVTWSTTDE